MKVGWNRLSKVSGGMCDNLCDVVRPVMLCASWTGSRAGDGRAEDEVIFGRQHSWNQK